MTEYGANNLSLSRSDGFARNSLPRAVFTGRFVVRRRIYQGSVGQWRGRQPSGNAGPARFDGWAVVEWECCIKDPEQGAAEGAPFISDHMITVTDKTFDDFAGTGSNEELNRKILGI